MVWIQIRTELSPNCFQRLLADDKSLLAMKELVEEIGALE